MPRSIKELIVTVVLLSFGLVLLFSSFEKGRSGTFVTIIYSVFKPFQQTVSFFEGKTNNLLKSYIWLVGVSKKNDELTEEVRKLRTEIVSLKEKELENRRLKRVLELKNRLDFPTVVAQVIGQDASGFFRTVLINKGSDEGVLPDMAVTVPEGIVGKINRSSATMAQVIMITDPSMSVDCRIERTRDRGLLTGSYSNSCLLQFVNKEADLKSQDIVVTSGLDGIFPRGLVVGTLQSVRLSEHGLFQEAVVNPSAKLSEIEEVIVILGIHGGFSMEPGLENKN
ncbi:MAG: rod shape-determining protein MreC [Desulfomonilaceae bacterium]